MTKDHPAPADTDPATEEPQAGPPGEGDTGAPDAVDSPPSEENPEDALEAARREAREHHDRYLRCVADLENFRKRAIREKEELRQFANAGLIEELFPVLDALTLAVDSGRRNEDARSLLDGVSMVLEQFKSVLAKRGIEEVHPAGETFDPNRHEAVSQVPDPEIPSGSVSQVVRKGYLLHGRLLRPASVVVSSGPTDSGDSKEKKEGKA